MAAAGLGRGDVLALLSHNCWQYPVIAFAAARRGIVLVPVNFMLGAEEVGYILEHSGAVALVVEDALVPVAQAALAPEILSRKVRVRVQLDLDPGVQLSGQWQPASGWRSEERREGKECVYTFRSGGSPYH